MKSFKLPFWQIIILLIFLITGISGFTPKMLSQSPLTNQSKTVIVAQSPQNLSIRTDLENFLDDFFDEQMEELKIPGAVVSIVQDGDALLTKGYGYADIEQEIPVDGEQTLFRVGSLAKLFTATAAMQLVDQGLINLDDDVNQYLPHFQIEQTYLEPITIHNLLTHTSGFSQQYIGVAARNPEEQKSLAEYVEEDQPPRVRPPGELYSYSTYDSDLLGYIVQEVSGTPFAEYIAANILEPLQMNHSTFDQPPSPELAANLATAYDEDNGDYEALPFIYLNIVPAGALSATAPDIARFMLAHLQDGEYENTRILSESSAQAMREQQFTDHPQLAGMGYALHERFRNDLRVLAHSAIFKGYTALASFVPEENLGIFIAYNRFEPKLHDRLTSQLVDRYYPVTEADQSPQPPADFRDHADRFTGTYRDIEYPQHTLTKITSLLGHVSVNKSNRDTLTVNFPEGFYGEIPRQESETELVEVEPLLFQRVDNDGFVAFEADVEGNITHMYHPVYIGPAGFEKLPWYETTYFQLPLTLFFLVIFISAVAIFPGSYLIPRFRTKYQHKSRMMQRGWLIAGIVAGLQLLLLVGLVLTFLLLEPTEFIYGLPLVVRGLLYLPIIAGGVTVISFVWMLLLWIKKSGSTKERLYYTLFTLSAIAYLPFLSYWNLLGNDL